MAKVTRTLIGSRVVSTGAVLDEFGECFSVKLGDDMSPPMKNYTPVTFIFAAVAANNSVTHICSSSVNSPVKNYIREILALAEVYAECPLVPFYDSVYCVATQPFMNTHKIHYCVCIVVLCILFFTPTPFLYVLGLL